MCSYVTLIGSWQSKHPKLNQEELAASIQCTGVRQTNNGCVQAYFFLPSPFPLLYFDVSTSPLESFSDLPQLAVSLNVQIDRTVKYACFAGLDLRSGNTDNK